MSSHILWIIWSATQQAWWGPGRFGYTTDASQAGRYTYAEAAEICRDVNTVVKVPAPESWHFPREGKDVQAELRYMVGIASETA